MGRFSWLAVVVAACGGSSTAPTKQTVLTNTTTAASEQSRNDVVKEALLALAGGDVDRLMALADPKGLYEYAFACKQDRDDDDLGDSKRLETTMRDDFTKAASKVKGSKVDVVSIRNEMKRWGSRRYGSDRERNATFIAKGGAVSSACVARTDLVFHEVEVRVRVAKHAGTSDGSAKELKAKLDMILAKGRWYVVKVPKDLAAGSSADGAVAKMEEFQKRMCDCKDKACADTVNEDMTKWGTEMARNASYDEDDRPDPDLARKSADIMTKYTECMTKLMMAGAGTP